MDNIAEKEIELLFEGYLQSIRERFNTANLVGKQTITEYIGNVADICDEDYEVLP